MYYISDRPKGITFLKICSWKQLLPYTHWQRHGTQTTINQWKRFGEIQALISQIIVIGDEKQASEALSCTVRTSANASLCSSACVSCAKHALKGCLQQTINNEGALHCMPFIFISQGHRLLASKITSINNFIS